MIGAGLLLSVAESQAVPESRSGKSANSGSEAPRVADYRAEDLFMK